jgi:hypothetical protein
MKIGDTIRRTSFFGDVVIRENIDANELKKSKELLAKGECDFEVLVDGKFVPVPKLIIHKAPPTGCSACEA